MARSASRKRSVARGCCASYTRRFLDHLHGFDGGDDRGCRPELCEAQHWPDAPLDGAMVLLDEVVQVLRLASLDGHAVIVDQVVYRHGVGIALSIVIFRGASCKAIARSKKRRAAALSRVAVSRKSTV